VILKKRIALVLVVAIAALAVGGMFGRLWAQRTSTLMQNLQLFGRVVELVITNYVERVDNDKLIRSAIRGMLESLDPHTEFLDEADYKELRVRTEGQFGGIGIHIGLVDEALTVIAPIEGTPAERAGLRGGDRIVEIEGKSTQGFTTEDAVKLLRGEPGTRVALGVGRPGVEKTMPFTLTREIINIKAVPYAAIVEPGIGYVRLADFSRVATRELGRSIDSLFGAGAKKLIFDLRSNGGGLLAEGKDVSDLFLPPGRVIVRTKGRIPESEREYVAETDDPLGDYPLVVLVDRGSASAAEIVAGALQDWERGLILGDTTFGKGSVQTIHQIGPMEAVKITTAYWYTPSGRCINRPRDRNGDVRSDSAETAGDPESSVIHDPGLDQDKQSYTLGKIRRPVHGGGAIVPDIVLQYDRIVGLGLRVNRDAFFDFAVEYTQRHKDLTMAFRADEAVLGEFSTFLRGAKKVEFTQAAFDSSREFFVSQIEREVAGKLFGMRGDYEMRLRHDPHVSRAESLLARAGTSEQLLKQAK
jgi:carboxyl-terminal processing protease